MAAQHLVYWMMSVLDEQRFENEEIAGRPFLRPDVCGQPGEQLLEDLS